MPCFLCVFFGCFNGYHLGKVLHLKQNPSLDEGFSMENCEYGTQNFLRRIDVNTSTVIALGVEQSSL